MDNNEKIAQGEPSLPTYAEQANGTQSGYLPQPGYTAQPDYPQKGSYPKQQPYTAQSGSTQPEYPLQEQQTSTTVVLQPTQAVILPGPEASRPPSWLCLSIFSCLCCLWPCGLAAIIYSTKVNSLYAAGDYEGARRNSNTARNLNAIAIVGGIIIIVIVIVRTVAIINQIG